MNVLRQHRTRPDREATLTHRIGKASADARAWTPLKCTDGYRKAVSAAARQAAHCAVSTSLRSSDFVADPNRASSPDATKSDNAPSGTSANQKTRKPNIT